MPSKVPMPACKYAPFSFGSAVLALVYESMGVRRFSSLFSILPTFCLVQLCLILPSLALGMSETSPSMEIFEAKYPPPPIGRWAAAYTESFANVYRLPSAGISKELSPAVDYMEMEALMGWKGNILCVTNMLVKQPNNLALYGLGTSAPGPEYNTFNRNRKLLHFMDIEYPVESFRVINTIYQSVQGYPKVGSTSSMVAAFYAKNPTTDAQPIPGYDYISTVNLCSSLTMDVQRYAKKYGLALQVNKASVWGKYTPKTANYMDPRHPKGKAFYDSLLYIKVPNSIIGALYHK